MFAKIGAPFTVLLALFVCALATADEREWKAPLREARRRNPVTANEQSLDAGKRAYTKECLSCHGKTGKGDGPGAADLKLPPSDLSDSSLWTQSDGELFWKITEGRKPMPTFAKLLSDDQRWHVVNYIRTLAPKPATQASTDGDSK